MVNDIPTHDLRFAGFPCEDYSSLKRLVTLVTYQADTDLIYELTSNTAFIRPYEAHAGLIRGWVLYQPHRA